jgi:hypothetical protein
MLSVGKKISGATMLLLQKLQKFGELKLYISL